LPPSSTDARDRPRKSLDDAVRVRAAVDVIADEHLGDALEAPRRDIGVDLLEGLGEKMRAAVNVADRRSALDRRSNGLRIEGVWRFRRSRSEPVG
jgi:hypothetical protein